MSPQADISAVRLADDAATRVVERGGAAAARRARTEAVATAVVVAGLSPAASRTGAEAFAAAS